MLRMVLCGAPVGVSLRVRAVLRSIAFHNSKPIGASCCVSQVYLQEDQLGSQALLIELLLSGFFAVACFRARATNMENAGVVPRTLLAMTDRLERLRRSRWQWFAMVLLLVLVRMQRGAPMVAELTVFAQLIVFMLLPTRKTMEAVR